MVEGKKKSRSKRRLKVKTPGGETVQHYRIRKPSKAKCGICKAELHGIPNKIMSKFKNMSKSQKTVERLYGGNLCSKCMRKTIKNNQ